MVEVMVGCAVAVTSWQFPDLDCGSCGAPSCRALAEDVVRGLAKESDCIFILREQIQDLANELSSIG
jgi:Na+-translocating ferredoxin:NAD+ oxidoreductase RNF subunit RnfB